MSFRSRSRAVACAAAVALVVGACGSNGDADQSESEPAGGETTSAAAAGSPGGETQDGPDLPEGWTYAAGSEVPSSEGGTPKLPASVTDGTGAKVKVDDVDRIIVGGDDVAEILKGLGLGDKVFAAPDNSTSPTARAAKQKYKFGRSGGAEGLLAIKGTLYIGNNPARHADVAGKFRAAGTPAVVMDDQQDTPAKIRAIASYVGLPAEGKKLAAAVQAQLKKASTDAKSVAGKKVLVVTATGAGDTNAVVGTGTAGADITDAIGVKNVGVDAKLRGYSNRYSNEALLAAQPDVIVMTTEDAKKWGGQAGFDKAFPTMAQSPAGKDKRFIVLPDDQIKYAGPAIGAGSQALAKAMVERLKATS